MVGFQIEHLHLCTMSFSSCMQQPKGQKSIMSVAYLQNCCTESWIELSSRPSSSSLSSAAADDTNPAALGVQIDQHGRRRRRLLRRNTDPAMDLVERRRSPNGGSSQEESEESESESDRVMTSSNENVGPAVSEDSSPLIVPAATINEDEDDENATALGVPDHAPVFTPPPNAFSHPYHGRTINAQRFPPSLETRASYFPAQETFRPSYPSSNSFPSRANRNYRSPHNMISTINQADNDAALRASLTTLLSCAAAARGLPKQDDSRTSDQRRRNNVRPRLANEIQPSTLRLVPESAIPQNSTSATPESTRLEQETSHEDRPPLPPRATSPSKKPKRKTSPSAKDRANQGSKKKARAQSPPRSNVANGNELIQPTLLTWMVSAGAVIIFSAISFSAGYAIGRQVGRLENGDLLREEGVVCGREVGRGLKRLRWGGTGGGLSVIKT